MRLFAVTPTYNSGKLLRETVYSIQVALECCPTVELVYCIVDGGSTDGSLEGIEFSHPRCRLSVISENDTGMYDALAKGFKMREGDMMFYLNAGDLLFPSAFFTLESVLMRYPESDWITFRTCGLDERGIPFGMRTPMPVNFNFLLRGGYGRFLPYIQQENSVWRPRLLDSLDMGRFGSHRLAGDYMMWHTFARTPGVKQVVVEALWAGFRIHPGQLSESAAKYREEVSLICTPGGVFGNLCDWLCGKVYGLAYHLPGRAKKFLSRRYIRLV